MFACMYKKYKQPKVKIIGSEFFCARSFSVCVLSFNLGGGPGSPPITAVMV